VKATAAVVLRFHVGLDPVVDQLTGERPSCRDR